MKVFNNDDSLKGTKYSSGKTSDTRENHHHRDTRHLDGNGSRVVGPLRRLSVQLHVLFKKGLRRPERNQDIRSEPDYFLSHPFTSLVVETKRSGCMYSRFEVWVKYNKSRFNEDFCTVINVFCIHKVSVMVLRSLRVIILRPLVKPPFLCYQVY